LSDEIGEKQKPVKRPHGLGRGLSALLGDVSREEPVAASANSAAPSSKAVQNIEVALIQPHPEQPRRHFDQDALQELADSIAKRGVIQPIIVRPHGGGFQIVAGERARLRRAGNAGNRAGRKYPARGSQPDRRGRGLSQADRRIPS
jgi:ParB family chromosome partitioning protein